MSITRENCACTVRFSASVRASSGPVDASVSKPATSQCSAGVTSTRRARSSPCTITRTEPSPSLSIRTTEPSVPTSYSSSARACITAPSTGSAPPTGFTTPSSRRLFPRTTSSMSCTALGSVSASGSTTCGYTTSWPRGRIGSCSIYCTRTDCGPESRAGSLVRRTARNPCSYRADALGIDRDGEAEAALERTDLHLHRVVVRLALVLRRALATDREDAVSELHGEVVRAHPGDVHVDDELGLRLVDVGGGLPLGGGDEAH